jgi:signal transduction histidine kinase
MGEHVRPGARHAPGAVGWSGSTRLRRSRPAEHVPRGRFARPCLARSRDELGLARASSDEAPDGELVARLAATVAATREPAALLLGDAAACFAHNARFAALSVLGDRSIGRPVGDCFPSAAEGLCAAFLAAAAGEPPTGGTLTLPGLGGPAHVVPTWLPLRGPGVAGRGALLVLSEVGPIVERLRRFLAMATHDLREPLFAVDYLAERCARLAARLGPEAKRDGDGLLSLLDRIESAVDDLGRFSLLSGGAAIELQPRPCDLSAVVREACEALSGARRAPLELRAVPVWGAWDALAVRRVVQSLVVNAWQYGPPGEPVGVTLALSRGRALLEVRDEGAGIPPDEAARLFEPSAGRTAVAWRSGTGLGLYVVRQLVRAHAGELALQRCEPRGFVVRVALPIAPS